MKPMMIAAAALLCAGAANAQDQTPTGQPASGQVYTGASAVADANNAAHAEVDARQATVDAVNAASTEGYAADMAAYRAAVRANHRAAAADARVYAHQQRAYADAMVAWRAQADACKRGHPAACNAPTPNPADFW